MTWEPIGRESQDAILKRALDVLAAGRGGFIAVLGQPGIGKSSLAGRIIEDAHARGCETAVVGASPVVVESGLGLWSRLAASRSRGHLAPTPPHPSVLEPGGVGLDPVDDDDDGDHPARLYRAGLDLLTRSESSPLLVVFEDLHNADEASLELLAQVAPTLGERGCLLLATWRAAAAHRQQRGRALLRTLDGYATSIEVPPLTEDACVTLLRRLAPTAPADWQRSFAAALRHHTGGNPLLVHLLADDLGIREGACPDPTVLDAGRPRIDVDVLLQRWLGDLTTEVHELLVMTALLGDTATITLLHDVLGPDATERLSLAQANGVLTMDGDRVAFTHPLLGEAVAADPMVDRAGPHRRIGEVLAEDWPGLACQHLAAAGQAADTTLTLRTARRAAEESRRSGDAAGRARALDIVLSAGPDDEVAVLLACADAHHRANHPRTAWERAERAARLLGVPSGPAEVGALVDAALLAARDRSLLVDGPRAIVLLRRADAALQPGDPRRIDVLASLAVLERTLPATAATPAFVRHLMEDGFEDEHEHVADTAAETQVATHWVERFEIAQPLIDEATALSERLDDPLRRARLHLAWRIVYESPEYARRRAAGTTAALRVLHEPEERSAALSAAVIDRVELADREGVDGAMAELEALARATGDLKMRWRHAQLAATLALARGGLDAAARHGELAARHAEEAHGVGGWLITPLQRAITALVAGEDVDELVTTLAVELPDIAYQPIRAAACAVVAAFGPQDGLAEILSGLAADIVDDPRRADTWLLSASHTGDAVVATNRLDLAPGLFGVLEPYASRVAIEPQGIVINGCVARVVGGLAALLGRPEEAAAYFAQGQKIDRALGFRRFELQGQLTELLWCQDGAEGEALRTAADRIQRLEQRARAMGLGSIARLAGAARHQAASPDLTERQHDVLQRLARGLTYTQIGSELGYSHSTVRHEAMRVYAALGVGGRDAAVAEARRIDLLPPTMADAPAIAGVHDRSE